MDGNYFISVKRDRKIYVRPIFIERLLQNTTRYDCYSLMYSAGSVFELAFGSVMLRLLTYHRLEIR